MSDTETSPQTADSNPKVPSTSDETRGRSTLFVRGIPYDCKNEELESFFSDIGPIRSCFVVQDTSEEGQGEEEAVRKPSTDKTNKGYGFVQFVVPEDAERAISELKKVKFRNERTLRIELALKKSHRAEKPVITKKPKKEKVTEDVSEEKSKSQKIPSSVQSIIISGLGSNVNKKQLYKKVRKFGEVKEVIFPVYEEEEEEEEEGKERKPLEGVAHVVFAKLGEAKNAIQHLNDHIFKGNKITAKSMAHIQGVFDKKARLIIRNLPFKLREEDLKNMFSKFGTVVNVNLPRKFGDHGPLRGFGFVQFLSLSEAEKALNAVNATKVLDRTIAVDWALAKDQYERVETQAEQQHELEEEKEDEEDDGEAEEEVSDEGIDGEEEEEEVFDPLDSDDEEEADGMEVDEAEEEEEVDDSEAGSGNDEDEEKEKIPIPPGTTLFLRNLSFDTQEEDLYEHFRQFGKLRYCRITMDHETGRSRGTGFVCFWNKEDAEKCVEENEKLHQTVNIVNKRSVLTPDAPSNLAAKFTLDDRILSVVLAVDRQEAGKLADINTRKRQKEDKRNIYLMKEGVILADSPAAQGLSQSEITKRTNSYAARKQLLARNPLLFISKTRLSVRNLPLKVDEVELRKLAVQAIQKFKSEVQRNEREHLTESERSEGWQYLPRVKQAKIIRSKDRIDPTTKKPRSKGYGFIEYSTHAHSLAALRYLNNNPDIFGDKKRLIVEFSVENFDVVKKRSERRSRNPDNAEQSEQRTSRDKNQKNKHSERQSSKRKMESSESKESPRKKSKNGEQKKPFFRHNKASRKQKKKD